LKQKNKIQFFTDPDNLPPDHLTANTDKDFIEKLDKGVKEIKQKLNKNKNGNN